MLFRSKNHTIESPWIGDETKGMVKIEFHQILATPNRRNYDNLTFLEKKIVRVNIYRENTMFSKRKGRQDKPALGTPRRNQF